MVIADSALNGRFLAACRDQGLTDSPARLNASLLNLRKRGGLQGITKSKRVNVRGLENFLFAAEIAVRFLERRDQTTLDRILCDPTAAAEFDGLAATIAPGFTPFQYRWAALSLRKRKRLKPEITARVAAPATVRKVRVSELRIEDLPPTQGLYLFFDRSTMLYVGEAQNLRKRISKHLEHSDSKGLARWLWEHGAADLHLEYHLLPPDTATRVRRALEAELILSRRPIFNVAGTP